MILLRWSSKSFNMISPALRPYAWANALVKRYLISFERESNLSCPVASLIKRLRFIDTAWERNNSRCCIGRLLSVKFPLPVDSWMINLASSLPFPRSREYASIARNISERSIGNGWSPLYCSRAMRSNSASTERAVASSDISSMTTGISLMTSPLSMHTRPAMDWNFFLDAAAATWFGNRSWGCVVMNCMAPSGCRPRCWSQNARCASNDVPPMEMIGGITTGWTLLSRIWFSTAQFSSCRSTESIGEDDAYAVKLLPPPILPVRSVARVIPSPAENIIGRPNSST